MGVRVKPVREKDVQRQILAYLKLRGIPAFRFNSGALTVGERFVRFHTARGCSDVLGVLPASLGGGGRMLAVEVKRPGGKGPTALQAGFLDTVRAAGGLAFIARSVEDVESALRAEGL